MGQLWKILIASIHGPINFMKVSIIKVTSNILFLILSSVMAYSTDLPRDVFIQQSIPSWVEIIEVDYTKLISAEETSGGVYYLLNNQQIYPEKSSVYWHNVLRLTSASGVEENSSISVTIDPDYQQLIWHRIDVVRDGERIDKLSTQKFRTSSNQGADDLIYDNRLNCLAIIEGTRKDDVIEYAYSVIGQNPILNDRYTGWFSLNYSIPVARISGRIVRDLNSRPLNFKVLSNHVIDLELPQPKILGDKKVYNFDLHDVASIHADNNTPSDYLTYSYLQVNDWNSWREVSQWGAALYNYSDVDSVLPEELQSALSEWRELRSDRAKALAALKWVQEEIRYVAIFIGPHNFKPYSIEQTLERGFGDCKDKSQLFCYLLSELGIDAVPILVNTSDKGLVGDGLPTPLSFNHVITHVKIEEKSFWLDPTNRSQGGTLDSIWHADYTVGLELSSSADSLISVPGQGAENSKSFVRETFALKGYQDDIAFTIYSRYSGAEADSQRRYFDNTTRLEVEKSYLNYYAQQFPGIKTAETLKYSDDLTANIVEVTESYTIPSKSKTDEAGNLEFQLDTYPNLIDLSLFLSDTRIRTMPAAQTYPLELTQIIEVILPEPGTFKNEKVQIETPWFKYFSTVETEENKLILNHQYRNLVADVAAKDYPTYAKKIDEVMDSLGYSISYSNKDQSAAIMDFSSIEPYPATFLSVFLFGSLGLVVSLWLVTRKRKSPELPAYPDLDGISGWLILPAIGIFFSPITFFVSLFVEQRMCFDAVWMQTYTIKTSEFYIPGFEVLILCEVGLNTFFLMLSLSLGYVFFKKRAILPMFYISFSVFVTVWILVDFWVANYLMIEAGVDPVDGEWTEIIRSIVSTLVWSTYFVVSDRARSTFRH